MNITRISLFIIFSILLVTIAISQEKSTVMEPPLEHKQSLYIDKDKRIYVPSKTPIYIRFATSPEDDAPSYLMYNEESMKSPSKDGFALPFYLEGPGRHSLVHPDANFWKSPDKTSLAALDPDRIFYFFEDGYAPKSKKIISKAPQIISGKTTIYGKTITITLESTDESSGLKNIYYSVDGAKFTTYENIIDFTKEGAYNLRFYSVDNVGNVENYSTFLFALDLTAPKTNHLVKNIHKGDILSPKAVFELSSTDNRAGVLKIGYRFDSANERTYKGKSVSPASLPDGDHKFIYYAEDKVGNIEALKTYDFYLDKTPPVVTTSIEGDQHTKNQTLFVSGSSQVKLTATDNKSGVDQIQYQIDITQTSNYTTPFGLPRKSGQHTIGYFASDQVGNLSKKELLVLTLDLSSPNSGCTFTGPKAQVQDTLYISNKTRISFNAKDSRSGVQKIQYQVDSKNVQTYTSPITIPEHGAHKIIYYATDNVNNKEKQNTVEAFVDNYPPEIYSHFSVESKRTAQLASAGKDIQVYPVKTVLYLGATDKSSGVEKIFYQTNKGKKNTYKTLIPFSKVGEYVIDIEAVDLVGNVSKKKLHFMIKHIPADKAGN